MGQNGPPEGGSQNTNFRFFDFYHLQIMGNGDLVARKMISIGKIYVYPLFYKKIDFQIFDAFFSIFDQIYVSALWMPPPLHKL